MEEMLQVRSKTTARINWEVDLNPLFPTLTLTAIIIHDTRVLIC